MQRRDFLARSLATGLAWTSASPGATTMPTATLGRTGVRVSRLALGCYFLGTEEVSQAAAEEILLRAVELGINYLDTAPNYLRSEEKMGPAIPKIRERVFLVSKTEDHTYDGTWKLLRQSLQRLRTDHLDLVHLHSLGNEERWPDMDSALGRKGALGALVEAKKQGVIRFIGASGHNGASRFRQALATGEIDVVMNAVNFVSQHVYNFEQNIWAKAAGQNLGLAAMKVLGGVRGQGEGTRIPKSEYADAFRYALSVPGAVTAVVGMKSIAELEENVRYVAAARPLSPEESIALWRKGAAEARNRMWDAPYGKPVY